MEIYPGVDSLHTLAPGVSVAQVARRYAMNANLIFKWLKDPRFQSDELETEESAFLPVEISTEPETALPTVTPTSSSMLGQCNC
jgi:transposase